jgi:hypothetical protein
MIWPGQTRTAGGFCLSNGVGVWMARNKAASNTGQMRQRLSTGANRRVDNGDWFRLISCFCVCVALRPDFMCLRTGTEAAVVGFSTFVPTRRHRNIGMHTTARWQVGLQPFHRITMHA